MERSGQWHHFLRLQPQSVMKQSDKSTKTRIKCAAQLHPPALGFLMPNCSMILHLILSYYTIQCYIIFCYENKGYTKLSIVRSSLMTYNFRVVLVLSYTSMPRKRWTNFRQLTMLVDDSDSLQLGRSNYNRNQGISDAIQKRNEKETSEITTFHAPGDSIAYLRNFSGARPFSMLARVPLDETVLRSLRSWWNWKRWT